MYFCCNIFPSICFDGLTFCFNILTKDVFLGKFGYVVKISSKQNNQRTCFTKITLSLLPFSINPAFMVQAHDMFMCPYCLQGEKKDKKGKVIISRLALSSIFVPCTNTNYITKLNKQHIPARMTVV
jgi:Zn finger protein HypA/HybF involved in hydrogenase expression